MINRQYTTRLTMALAVSLTSALPTFAQDAQNVWLGIQLTPVPRMLDAHLQLEGRGVMVRNVFLDSPADRAGVDRYDIITEVDGEPVVESVESFSRHVRQRAPGDEVKLTLIHEGQPQTIPVVLEVREKDWSEIKPKYRDEPDLSHSREFDLRGHILKPGPKGWTWHDLGEMPEVFNFMIDPDREDALRPPPPEVTEAPEQFEARHVDEDGNIIHVERRNNGTIVVTRLKAGQHTDEAEVKEYVSVEELQENDPEAAKLFENIEPRRPRADSEFFDRRGRRTPNVYPPEWRWRDWQRQFRRALPPSSRANPEGLREFDIDLRIPPQTSFEVKPDGTIDVHVQGQDSELHQTFESADELREKAPKLFEKFDRLYGQLR